MALNCWRAPNAIAGAVGVTAIDVSVALSALAPPQPASAPSETTMPSAANARAVGRASRDVEGELKPDDSTCPEARRTRNRFARRRSVRRIAAGTARRE